MYPNDHPEFMALVEEFKKKVTALGFTCLNEPTPVPVPAIALVVKNNDVLELVGDLQNDNDLHGAPMLYSLLYRWTHDKEWMQEHRAWLIENGRDFLWGEFKKYRELQRMRSN